MKKAKSFFCILLALTMVFALAACGSSSAAPAAPAASTASSGSAAPAEAAAPAAAASESAAPASEAVAPSGEIPDTITIGFSGGLGRFLAGIAPSESFTGCDAVFDSIFKTDPETKEITSDVLESWGWKDDTTFEMKMRDDVYFSNGDNATAEDLIFSYANHPERGSNYLNSFGILMDECVATDTYTAEFKFEKPYVAFTNTIIYLVDKSWSEEVGWDSMEWYQPVGSGPYKCTEYVADDHMVLEARDDYWNKEKGEIVVKKWILKNYADSSTMFMDLETGKIQMCQTPTADYDRYVKEGGDGYDCVLASTGVVCYFNYGFLNNPIWQNQTLREAIAAGVDWATLGELAYGNMYVPANSLVPEMSKEYVDVGQVVYDPDRAKELLAEAGYAPGELKLHTFMMDDPFYRDLCEGFQFYMQELGIECDLEFGDVSTTIAKWVDPASGIDFGFFYYIAGSPAGMLRLNTWNAGDPNGVKWGYFDDEEFQALYAEHCYTTDPELSVQRSKECQQLVYDKTLAVPFCEDVKALAYDNTIFTGEQMLNCYIGADNYQITKLAFASGWD